MRKKERRSQQQKIKRVGKLVVTATSASAEELAGAKSRQSE